MKPFHRIRRLLLLSVLTFAFEVQGSICEPVFRTQVDSFFTVERFESNIPTKGREGVENKIQKVRVDIKQLELEFAKLLEEFPERFSKRFVDVPGGNPIIYYVVRNRAARRKILITSGVHGDEAMGVVTSFDFVRSELRRPNSKYKDFNFYVFPTINPKAIEQGKRALEAEGDYNRQFFETGETPESIRSFMLWVRAQDFYRGYDLHQVLTRSDFYIIEGLKNDQAYADRVIESLPKDLRLSLKDYFNYWPLLQNYHQRIPGVLFSGGSSSLRGFLESIGVEAYTMEAPGVHDAALVRIYNLHLLQNAISELQ